jgi:hypothetical protein
LSTLLRRFGIEFRESVDEIVQGTSEVVTNLTDQRTQPDASEGFTGQTDIYRAMGGFGSRSNEAA